MSPLFLINKILKTINNFDIQGNVGKWERCGRLSYKFVIADTRPYHANLSRKGYRSLIYRSVSHYAATNFKY